MAIFPGPTHTTLGQLCVMARMDRTACFVRHQKDSTVNKLFSLSFGEIEGLFINPNIPFFESPPLDHHISLVWVNEGFGKKGAVVKDTKNISHCHYLSALDIDLIRDRLYAWIVVWDYVIECIECDVIFPPDYSDDEETRLLSAQLNYVLKNRVTLAAFQRSIKHHNFPPAFKAYAKSFVNDFRADPTVLTNYLESFLTDQ